MTTFPETLYEKGGRIVRMLCEEGNMFSEWLGPDRVVLTNPISIFQKPDIETEGGGTGRARLAYFLP